MKLNPCMRAPQQNTIPTFKGRIEVKAFDYVRRYPISELDRSHFLSKIPFCTKLRALKSKILNSFSGENKIITFPEVLKVENLPSKSTEFLTQLTGDPAFKKVAGGFKQLKKAACTIYLGAYDQIFGVAMKQGKKELPVNWFIIDRPGKHYVGEIVGMFNNFIKSNGDAKTIKKALK